MLGEIGDGEDVLIRVHSECLTGDVFALAAVRLRRAARRALEMIGEEGRGVVLYIRGHEGRAIGLTHKLRAYELQDRGRDTVEANVELGFPADPARLRHRRADPGRPRRPHDAAAHEQPAKRAGLEGYGLSIAERVPLETKPTAQNIGYLRTKREKLGHLLDGLSDPTSIVEGAGER